MPRQFPLARLGTSRVSCTPVHRRPDALFELRDALLCGRAVLSHHSLELVCQARLGQQLCALARGRIDTEGLHDLHASCYLRRVSAARRGPWLHCGNHCFWVIPRTVLKVSTARRPWPYCRRSVTITLLTLQVGPLGLSRIRPLPEAD